MRDAFSKVLEDNADTTYQVRFSPNGRRTANADGRLRIWNARKSQLVKKWTTLFVEWCLRLMEGDLSVVVGMGR
jgi:hypothetical protein